ncbi:hypothetical protein [Lacticaseibacillus saniviri]|uniref:hypothetical protein n=1 Tax=Lacticaseibacillus saniviri TaxID=931533 RepID=UPI0006D0C581|nr:hypothetical protein [Lacticaseibacillus saniviri]
MKRFAVLVAAAVAVVGLAGCGSNTASDKNAGNIKLTMNQLDSKKILTSKAFDVDTDGGYYKLSGKAAPGQTVVLLDSYDDYDEEEPTANEEMRTKADKMVTGSLMITWLPLPMIRKTNIKLPQ